VPHLLVRTQQDGNHIETLALSRRIGEIVGSRRFRNHLRGVVPLAEGTCQKINIGTVATPVSRDDCGCRLFLSWAGDASPGTTLQAVCIPCFSLDRHALWDTPGIISKERRQLFPWNHSLARKKFHSPTEKTVYRAVCKPGIRY
jgi:hypothetical protein